jgi:hypothetical protein
VRPSNCFGCILHLFLKLTDLKTIVVVSQTHNNVFICSVSIYSIILTTIVFKSQNCRIQNAVIARLFVRGISVWLFASKSGSFTFFAINREEKGQLSEYENSLLNYLLFKEGFASHAAGINTLPRVASWFLCATF